MKDNDVAVLLEDINDKLSGVVESVDGMRDMLTVVEQRLQQVESNTELIPAIRAAITDQSDQLNRHEARLQSLEDAG